MSDIKINYQLMLENITGELVKEKGVPRLLLHTCCAPCASYVLEYLTEFYDITCYFYNPNITSEKEYKKRADELLKLVSNMPKKHSISVIIEDYNKEPFLELSKGLEGIEEGGERCFKCYSERLFKTAEYMRDNRNEYDVFATTLTVSPHKNAPKLNLFGNLAEQRFKVRYLPSDFKKRDGYKRSIELSHLYGLYRQNFCGCIYSEEKALERIDK